MHSEIYVSVPACIGLGNSSFMFVQYMFTAIGMKVILEKFSDSRSSGNTVFSSLLETKIFLSMQNLQKNREYRLGN